MQEEVGKTYLKKYVLILLVANDLKLDLKRRAVRRVHDDSLPSGCFLQSSIGSSEISMLKVSLNRVSWLRMILFCQKSR